MKDSAESGHEMMFKKQAKKVNIKVLMMKKENCKWNTGPFLT